MFGIVHFPLFVAAVFLLNITPGPDTAYIVGRSVAQGRVAGLMSALGISGGCCFHSLACAFGLTALIAASAAAFTVVKVVGAIYLIYLGARMLLAREQGSAAESATELAIGSATELVPSIQPGQLPQSAQSTRSGTSLPAPGRPVAPAQPLRKLFLQGFWTNVLNPKVVLFFVSFFPQFVATDASHKALTFLALGAVFVLMSTLWNSMVAWLAAGMTRRMSGRPALRRWIDRVVGCAFVGLGVRLAVLRR